MSLLALSNEYLLEIFKHLDISQLFRLMHSCRRLSYCLRYDNRVWKIKFIERWPKISLVDEWQVNWLEMVSLRLKVKVQVMEEVWRTSTLSYPEGPEMNTPEIVFDALTSADFPHLDFIDEELSDLKFNPPENLANDLTFSYHVNHLYTKVRMCVLEKKWLNFMERQEKSLFEGALLFSEWVCMDFSYQPCESESVLNSVTEKVKFLLGVTPNFLVDGTVQPSERDILTNITKVLFDKNEMCMLNLHVDELEIDERNENVGCYCFCPTTFSVDKVLVPGDRIGHNNILCIIYEEVAKRMGVLCQPIFCYKVGNRSCQRVVLRWEEFPELDDGYTYIDMHKKGSLKNIDESRRLGPVEDDDDDHVYYDVDVNPAVATVEQILQDMLDGKLDSVSRRGCSLDHDYTSIRPYCVYPTSSLCRLAIAMSPSSTELAKSYANFCERNHIQFGDAIRISQALGFPCDDLKFLLNEHKKKIAEVVSYRSPSVKYAVGLIMIHKDSSRGFLMKDLCVITSWDLTCKGKCADGISVDQPFYNILLDQGESLYVPEEKLELPRKSAPTRVKNWDLGVHFSRFDGRVFVPNAMCKSRFPEDEEFARSLAK